MSVTDKLNVPGECPKCAGKSVAYILYGLPIFEKCKDDLDRKLIVLGGCAVSENDPQWRCNSCAHEWGELLDRDDMVRVRLDSERRRQERIEKAVARGTMTAYINDSGSVTFPHCNRNFKVAYGLTPEGAHGSCGTLLRILPMSDRSGL